MRRKAILVEIDERKGCYCRLELDRHFEIKQNIMRNDMNHVNEKLDQHFRMSRA